MSAARFLVVHWPDWPVVAAGCPPGVPAAVVAAHRVVAVTPAARAEGVVPGLRRREAQGRCPGLEVVAADGGRDARVWEPVVAAVEALTTSVEVLAPGTLCLSAHAASRYYGGDEALAERVRRAAVEAAVEAAGAGAGAGCSVGVADGRFAAGLAARAAAGGSPLVIPPGGSREWLSPQPVGVLGSAYSELTDLLIRLGLASLGDLAALPAPAVLARFGPEGVAAHRLALGLDERPLQGRTPPPDLGCQAEFDPPEQRVEAAAFVAKSLAGDLLSRLAAAGLAATMVAIGVETEYGESLVRQWRHDGDLTAQALAERTRWQLDGWLSGGLGAPAGGGRPAGGLTRLRLDPLEVRPGTGRQLGFWGGVTEADARAGRAMARVQGMLGPEAVVTAVLVGGRSPADQVRLVPWGDDRAAAAGGGLPKRPATAREAPSARPPWPGRLPVPAPAVVHQPPLAARLCGEGGETIEVSGRGELNGVPAALAVSGAACEPIVAWAGPWPVEERWWDGAGRRRARFQVLLGNGQAHLVHREAGSWWVEATYA